MDFCFIEVWVNAVNAYESWVSDKQNLRWARLQGG